MAFYDDKDEDQEQNGQPVATGAQSGVISGSGAAPSAAGAAAAPKTDNNFVGISQYIDANKPQSEKLANQVAGSINDKAAGVDTALNSAQNSFNQAADSQKVNEDDDLLNQVKTNAAGVAGDANKTSQFAQERDATYNGPNQLEDLNSGQDWAGIQSAIQSAKDAKAQTGTEAGRMGLIQQVSNNPRQSQGALTFDNLLLQSNPNAAGILNNAGSSLNDIDQRLTTADQTAGQYAQGVAAGNQGVATAAQNALTGGYSGLSSDLASREAAADAQQKASVQALQNSIQTGQLTPAQLQQLGMAGTDKTYGADLSQFINYNDGIDKYSVANQDDLARQAALKSLAGSYNLGDDILSGSTPIGQSGSGFTTDATGYQNAQDTNIAAYNKALNSVGSSDWDPGDHNGQKSPPLSQLISTYTSLANDKDNDASQKAYYQQALNSVLKQQKALQDQYGFNQTLQQGVSNQVKRTSGV